MSRLGPLRAVLFTAALAAVLVASARLGFFQSARGLLSDALFIGYEPPANIVIVAIDDASIREIGRFPWRRSVHVALIEKLTEAGAKAVGYDVNFPEPTCAAGETGAACADDAKLAAALREAGNVVLPLEATFVKTAGETSPFAVRPIVPIPELTAVAPLGFVNTPPDADGVFRRVPLTVRGVSVERNRPMFRAVFETAFPGRELSQTEGSFIVNYAGPKGTFRTIPFADVINDRVDPAMFRDAIVLVGATAPDLHDVLTTPTAKRDPMPGIEVHANAIATELSGRNLRDLPAAARDILIVLFCAIAAAAMLRLRLRTAWLIVGGTFGLYGLATFALFDVGIVGDLFYPPLALAFASGATMAERTFREKAERLRTRTVLERYVSGAVVRDLMAHPEKLELGGERREMTVLFSDLRGFTSISEKLSPEELVAVLNTYLDVMTGLVFAHEGVLDKYMGDAIMAFWGAPYDDAQHAMHAVETGLAMRTRLVEMNAGGAFPEGVTLKLGIGVNSGPMVVGNMGSKNRFDYTVMGDAVNLGSRLEGLNKDYGTEIIVSESTKKLIGHGYLLRPLDRVAVKGKKEPIDIFEVVCGADDATDAQKMFVKHFAAARDLYLARKFTEARDAFHAMAHVKPEDVSLQNYIARCEQFLEESPPADWDGTLVKKTK
ncbi:adenylate/guanylate cyclase domain-containing protein [Patescibacteria group bacterium]|nr:MAG: adenylate/guanylate cyclase domain-containing protein [Patescibacteria group bacterium]